MPYRPISYRSIRYRTILYRPTDRYHTPYTIPVDTLSAYTLPTDTLSNGALLNDALLTDTTDLPSIDTLPTDNTYPLFSLPRLPAGTLPTAHVILLPSSRHVGARCLLRSRPSSTACTSGPSSWANSTTPTKPDRQKMPHCERNSRYMPGFYAVFQVLFGVFWNIFRLYVFCLCVCRCVDLCVRTYIEHATVKVWFIFFTTPKKNGNCFTHRTDNRFPRHDSDPSGQLCMVCMIWLTLPGGIRVSCIIYTPWVKPVLHISCMTSHYGRAG